MGPDASVQRSEGIVPAFLFDLDGTRRLREFPDGERRGHVQSSAGSVGGQVINCGFRRRHRYRPVRLDRPDAVNEDVGRVRGSPTQRGRLACGDAVWIHPDRRRLVPWH